MTLPESCPHFFKVFLPNLSSEFLKIPPAFQRHISVDSSGMVSLKGPSGNIWVVELINYANEFRFKNGWKEFVADHSLETGDFLVFRLDEPICFSVMIFDATACQKQAAFAANPLRGDVSDVIDANKDEEKEVKIKKEYDDSPMLALPSTEDVDIEEKKRRLSPPTPHEPTLREMYTPLNDILVSRRLKQGHKNGKRKNKSITDFRAVSGGRIWETGNLELKKESPVSSSPSQDSSKPSSKKLVGPTSSEKLNKSIELWNFMKSNEVRRRGSFVAKIQRVPVLVSQRRPVTAEEVDKALQASSSFISKRPVFSIVMQDSYVYQGFYMNVPYSFMITYVSRNSRNITLWDPTDRPWPVTYLTHGNCAGFSAGWGAFSWGNNLEKDDVCVFELFKKDNFKVRIFRVVPEVKPLLKRSELNQ